MSENIYLNIKKIRELRNHTREYVAAELDMSTSGYGKIERGEIDITVSKLYKLSEILNVKVNYILNFDTSRFFTAK